MEESVCEEIYVLEVQFDLSWLVLQVLEEHSQSVELEPIFSHFFEISSRVVERGDMCGHFREVMLDDRSLQWLFHWRHGCLFDVYLAEHFMRG